MNTKNLGVGALAALLTLALWYNFLLKPTQSQTSKVKSDIAARKQQLVPLQAQVDQANADAEHQSTLKARLASLETAVPTTPALAAFIRDANDIATASAVSWQSVTHAPPVVGADGVATITVGITVKGTYDQVMDYITRLNALKRLLVVDNVLFSAASAPTAASTSTSGGAGSATGGGATSGSDLSTGPFSGASQLSVTISARMFENPPVTLATGTATGTGTGTAPSSTGATPPSGSAQTSTLNNS
jgi:Tfp pilus assembly protein PilO